MNQSNLNNIFSSGLVMSINVDDIDSNVSAIRNSINEALRNANSVNASVSKISELWIGEASKIYVSKNNELLSRLKNYIDELDQVCEAFKNVSSSIRDTESELERDFID